MADCLFCKIAEGAIPAKLVAESPTVHQPLKDDSRGASDMLAFFLDQSNDRLVSLIAMGDEHVFNLVRKVHVSGASSRLHGAVQFAVFSSLTMLIGTLGRGALGEMIKTDGYASVFIFTMWLGGIAVVACALEWARQARAGH